MPFQQHCNKHCPLGMWHLDTYACHLTALPCNMCNGVTQPDSAGANGQANIQLTQRTRACPWHQQHSTCAVLCCVLYNLTYSSLQGHLQTCWPIAMPAAEGTSCTPCFYCCLY